MGLASIDLGNESVSGFCHFEEGGGDIESPALGERLPDCGDYLAAVGLFGDASGGGREGEMERARVEAVERVSRPFRLCDERSNEAITARLRAVLCVASPR